MSSGGYRLLGYRLLSYVLWRSGRNSPMNATGYRLLGFALWRGAKWYLRRRLRSPRIVLLGASAVFGLLDAGARIAMRAAR